MNGRGYILVVNDNEALIETTCDWLRGLGRELKIALTGKEGVQMCETEPPALILLDYHLRKDGPETTASDFIPKLRKECAAAPIIIMSSATDKTLTATLLGVEEYIVINGIFDWSTLASIVRRYLKDKPVVTEGLGGRA